MKNKLEETCCECDFAQVIPNQSGWVVYCTIKERFYKGIEVCDKFKPLEQVKQEYKQ